MWYKKLPIDVVSGGVTLVVFFKPLDIASGFAIGFSGNFLRCFTTIK